MTKVQLTLTSEEANLLSLRATKLGYGLTRYIKHLVSQEAIRSLKEKQIPLYKMSARAEKRAKQALKDYHAGKAKLLKTVDDLDWL